MKTLILLGLILLIPLSTMAMLASGTVTGTVVDAEGKTVPNQKVRIKKVISQAPIGNATEPKKPSDNLTVASLTTDKDGKFTQSLDAGQYWAEAGSKTLGYDKQKFEIKPGEISEIKLTLTKDDAPGK